MKWIALSFIVMALALGGCGGDEVRLSKGDVAPNFTLVDLAGKTTGRLSDLRGEVVVVHFWNEECRFCEGEMRWLEPIYQRLHPEGFRLLAVNAGQDRKTAQRFIARVEVSYPALLDEDSTVTKRYGVIALPTTVLVDRKGIVRQKFIGESDPATFEAVARQLVEEH